MATVLGLAVLVAGCKGKEDDAGAKRGDIPTIAPVFGVPNLDDDDDNGKSDWRDEGASDDDDLAPLDLTALAEALLNDDLVTFSLTGNAPVRVWAGGAVLADETTEGTLGKSELADPVLVEFGDFAAGDTLTLTVLKKDGSEVDRQQVRLQGAPAILNHHLQPFERAFAVFDNGYNDAMIADMDDVMGNTFISRDVFDYDFDVWVQDEFETATLTSPTSRIDVVIDSIRSDGYGLDAFPERVVAKGGNSVVQTWGKGFPNSQDSFGNLEVSPPVTVDGVEYPFGRIYYGEWAFGETITNKLTRFMEDQRVQDPFTLDVSFLCVGHVDEFTTFLPDPTAPKGFRLYIADIPEGLAFLEGLGPDYALPRYGRDHGYGSVGEILDDRALIAINEDYQRDYIDPTVDRFKAELGLDDGDIVRVPALFEEIGACGPYGLALIPATVNMLVSTGEDGAVEAFLPDPFLRGDDEGPESDPFVALVNDLLPANVTPHWVDNWYTYHLAWGEVHCGTNTVRTPTANWWDDAMHLLEGGE
ncbi:MAG: hypothetical protein ACI8PZ_003438 [Myxococcota bacterium]|jgi:hypothetical protein